MTVHGTELPHPSLSQSQRDNARTYLFPFVSMGTWGNKDRFQFLFFLSLPSCPSPLRPHLPLLLPFPVILLPSFVGTDNRFSVFFPEGCSNKNIHYENMQTIKLEKKETSFWAWLFNSWNHSDGPQEFLSPHSLPFFIECPLVVRD